MFISRYHRDLAAARRRVNNSGSRVAETPLGKIEYLDCGAGSPVLWVHGIVGGADQGPAMARTYLGEGFRVIAISRFGYLGSPLPVDPSPAAQSDLYACLFDLLGLSKVTLVGTSAGTASSLQFALRHPDRCSALVLWSMAVPPYPIPSPMVQKSLRAFFGSDFIMWALISYLPAWMQRIMGVPRSFQSRLTAGQIEWLRTVMIQFLPTSQRIDGIMNDVNVSNPGVNNGHLFQQIEVPSLIIHAVDDPMPPFATAKQISERMLNARFLEISEGGHLLLGHFEAVRAQMAAFVRQHAEASDERIPISYEGV